MWTILQDINYIDFYITFSSEILQLSFQLSILGIQRGFM